MLDEHLARNGKTPGYLVYTPAILTNSNMFDFYHMEQGN
jgi:hypothetical protein